MNAKPEREVAIGLAIDVEAVRRFELPFISVGRTIHQQNRAALRNDLAVNLDVSIDEASLNRGGRLVAK